jgi:hypothetical protein
VQRWIAPSTLPTKLENSIGARAGTTKVRLRLRGPCPWTTSFCVLRISVEVYDVKREATDLWLQDHSWRLTKCTKRLNMTSERNSMISDTSPILTTLLCDCASHTCTYVMYYYGRQNNH